MNLFSGLGRDASIKDDERDSVGGSRILESDVYTFKVDVAFMSVATSEAVALNLHLTDEATDKQLRTQLWVKSGKLKGGKNTSTNSNGDVRYLPGFLAADALCLLTLGETLADQEKYMKKLAVKVYDFDEKKDVSKQVDAIDTLTGVTIKAGVIKRIVDINEKDDNGNWVPSGRTREVNEIDKFFRESDNFTVPEIKSQADAADFIDTWLAKWKGKEDNRAKGAVEGANQASQSAGTTAPASTTGSLFKNK